jgi:tetratricopeptide (TPR) repeat protein
MTKLSPIIYLKDTLPEDSWSWVIPALRQDSVIWESLQDQDFLKLAVQEIGNNPKDWTPLNLALLSLGGDLAVDELGTVPLEETSPYLHQQSVLAYKNHTGENPPAVDIRQAGMLALYFLEHPAEGKYYSPATSISCLYSLFPDPIGYLSQFKPEISVHVILSNPQDTDEQVQAFSHLLDASDPAVHQTILSLLAFQRPGLAAEVTQGILDNHSTSSTASFPNSMDSPLGDLSALLADADFHSIAGRQGEHLEITKEAWKKAGELKNALAAKMTALKITQGDLEGARLHWDSIKDDISDNQVAEIILTLCTKGFIREALDWFIEETAVEVLDDSNPENNIVRGLLLHHQGEKSAAKTAAGTALAGYSELENRNPDYLQLLSKLFLTLNQPKEALKAVNLALEIQPNNPEIISLLLKVLQAANLKIEGVQAAHLAVAIQPTSLEARRRLALFLEVAGHWSHAMQERETIMTRQQSPGIEDVYKYASTAIKAGHPQKAVGICQKIIQSDQNDPEAHHLLGEAYNEMGDLHKAKTHLIQVTQLAPDSAQSWLLLADIYKGMDQNSEQRETIQAASNAIPNDPAICLAMGEISLEDGAPTQALNAFRKAEKLVRNSETKINQNTISKVAFTLGKTLLQLGHLDEARETLEPAYAVDPEHMGIAHAYARTLLATDLPELAIPILDDTRKKNPEGLDIHLDYAKACLATSTNLDETKNTLVDITEANPDLIEAKAYLAEAYEVNHELEASIEAYQEALSSPLHNDPSWNAKLSLGLGRVTLKAGNPEAAIATLKSALRGNDEDVDLLKTLSAAYFGAGMEEKAFWTANSVLEIDPNNDDNLDWFIQQAIKYGAADEAIDVLGTYLKSNPKRASLLSKLGWLYLYGGDDKTAKDLFLRIKTIDEVTPPDLYAASQGLIAVKDPTNAIECLEKAIYMVESTGENSILPKLFNSKSTAHQMNANLNKALTSIEMAISLSPEDHNLIQRKAEILLGLGKPDAAVGCIEAGIDEFPHNTYFRLLASIIYRNLGDLTAASNHARDLLALFTGKGPNSMDMLTAATIADLADSMMLKNLAADTIAEAAEGTGETDLGAVQYYCIQGEATLDSGEEIAAANALTAAMQINPEHPRVLALQARLTLLQGNIESANQILQKGIEAVGDYTGSIKSQNNAVKTAPLSFMDQPASIYIALAEASLGFQKWDLTNQLLEKAVTVAPNEPRTNFKLARFLVVKAENQRLFQLLNIVNRAPGQSAIEETAYQKFEAAILKAAHLVTEITPPSDNLSPSYAEAESTITAWLSRGQAIFQPSPEHAEALSKLANTPENLTAQIAALRHCGDLTAAAKTASRIYAKMGQNATDPNLLGQIALALTKSAPETALDAIKTAIEISSWRNLPNRPVFNAICAYIAGRIQQPLLQIQSMQDALTLWMDETNWLSITANLHLNQNEPENISKAIQYLEKGAELEPEKVGHYLKLGEAHQRLGNQRGALVVLDQATRRVPQQPEPWMALANIHHSNGDVPQAIRCAKKVVEIYPAHADAQILLAEVALEVDNPKKAAQYIDDTITHHPDNSQALRLRAKIYAALDDPEEALVSIEKLLPKQPKSIPLHLQRVQLLQKVKGPESALAALVELAEQNPDEPRILAAFAKNLSNLNNIEDAIKKAQAALSHGIQDLDPNAYIENLELLGRLLRKSGQLDQAIHYLSEAIEQAPDVPNSYIEIGRCYQEQRQYEKALQKLENAISIAPTEPDAYYFAGLIFKENKDFLNAERMFKHAAKLAPTNLNFHRQLGAVTAINLVHNNFGHLNPDHKSQLVTPVERMEP